MMTLATVWRRATLRPTERFALSADEAPADIDAGYAAIRDEMAARAGEWAAWKLGGTNHATKAAYAVEVGYFGAIHDSELLIEPASGPHLPLCQLQGEVEIALRIGADRETHDAWAVALEMPASALTNLPGIGVGALVADRCAAGALLLGPVREGALPDLSASTFVLERDGAVLAQASYAALVADPVALLAEFIRVARAQGFDPAPGQWVSTGGISPCYSLGVGERIIVRLDGVAQIDCVMDLSTAGPLG